MSFVGEAHPFCAFLNDNVDELELVPKESRLWSSFSAFLKDSGGKDFISSFARCSGCYPGSLCDHCIMDIMDRYNEGFGQIVGSFLIDDDNSNNNWNSICMRIGTWNSSGLLCFDVGHYKAKMSFFRKTLSKLDVFCIQETHDDGNEVQFVDHLHAVGKDFRLWRSFIDAATGGLAFFIRKDYCMNFDSIQLVEIIAGRIAAVEMYKGGIGTIIINVHIH